MMLKFPVSEAKIQDLLYRMKCLDLEENDLEENFIRGSGAGGQKINKTSVVVHLRHKPSGCEVRCQESRSQALNRFLARRLLVEKLEKKIFAARSEKQKQIEKIRRQKRRRSKRAKEKILRAKRMISEKKNFRKKPGFDLRKIFLLTVVLFFFTLPVLAWRGDFRTSLKNGGAYVVSEKGEVLFDYRSDQTFIPASIVKIATAACALYRLGQNFRFETFFYLTKDHTLVVKGFGDPFLVSEEFFRIVSGLKQAGLKEVTGLILDSSYFEEGLAVDGKGQSDNPYDAVNGALVANFNTVAFQKLKNGSVISAEEQTPLTPIAMDLARKTKAGKHRVNLGSKTNIGVRYFGELLTAFLEKGEVEVSGPVQVGVVPESAELLYRHRSSKTLQEIVADFLEYSTNFTANQLFLVLGAKAYEAPATFEKGQKVLHEFLRGEVGWKSFELWEGAGLSRANRVTAKQMMTLLDFFEPYRGLLPEKYGVIRAKTGTLYGVNTYAGYFPKENGELIKFVILVNDQVAYDYKFRLARKLYQGVTGRDVPGLK